MDNLKLEITPDDILVMKVDLKKDVGPTRYGNSIRISSSQGNLQLWKDGQPHPRNIRVNLNVFRSLTEEDKKKGKFNEDY